MLPFVDIVSVKAAFCDSVESWEYVNLSEDTKSDNAKWLEQSVFQGSTMVLSRQDPKRAGSGGDQDS